MFAHSAMRNTDTAHGAICPSRVLMCETACVVMRNSEKAMMVPAGADSFGPLHHSGLACDGRDQQSLRPNCCNRKVTHLADRGHLCKRIMCRHTEGQYQRAHLLSHTSHSCCNIVSLVWIRRLGVRTGSRRKVNNNKKKIWFVDFLLRLFTFVLPGVVQFWKGFWINCVPLHKYSTFCRIFVPIVCSFSQLCKSFSLKRLAT